MSAFRSYRFIAIALALLIAAGANFATRATAEMACPPSETTWAPHESCGWDPCGPEDGAWICPADDNCSNCCICVNGSTEPNIP